MMFVIRFFAISLFGIIYTGVADIPSNWLEIHQVGHGTLHKWEGIFGKLKHTCECDDP